MTYTEQLEREAEQARMRLADDIDELRASLSPGQIVDHLVDYARGGSGARFLHNLKQQATDNPLPITLMGAGLAWLMASGRNGASHRETYRAPYRDRETGTGAGISGDSFSDGSGIGDTARSAAESTKGMVSSAYNSASSAYDSVTDAASRTGSAVADTARHMTRTAGSTGRSFVDFCSEQPLVLAGLGLAIGAALGAMMPATEAENRLMGEASDAAKDEVKEQAAATYDKAAAVGERALDAAKDEAQKQGLTGAPGDGSTGDGERFASDERDAALSSPAARWEERTPSAESEYADEEVVATPPPRTTSDWGQPGRPSQSQGIG